MAVVEQDEVRAALEPIHGLIAKVIELAHREDRVMSRLRIENGFRPRLYSRTVSNDVFDAVAGYAIPILGADPRVHVYEESQTVKFFVGGKVMLRFKQGDDDKLSYNHPTQAVLDYHDPNVPCRPDLPPETAKIEIVWLPNATKTGYDGIFVVARDQDDVVWEYEIPLWAEEQDGTIVQFPRPPKDDSDQDDLSHLVAAKKQDDENEGNR